MGSPNMAMAKLALLLLVAVLSSIEDTRSENTFVIAPIPGNLLAKFQDGDKEKDDGADADGSDYALGRPSLPKKTKKPSFLKSGSFGWDYCTKSSPCDEGVGDCDYDVDCKGSLVCGNGHGHADNCIEFNSQSVTGTDCCIRP